MIYILYFITGKGGTGKSQKMISILSDTIASNVKNGHSEYNKNVYVIVPEQFSLEFDRKLYNTIDSIDHSIDLSNDDFRNDTTIYSPNIYNSLGAYKYNQINVTKFTGIAEKIIKKYGKNLRDYINDLSKVIAMHQAIESLKEDQTLNVFQKQAQSIDFISLALNEVTSLKKNKISAELLMEKSQNTDLTKQVKSKAFELSLIYQKYENILKSKNLQDAISDISECTNLVEQNMCFKDATFFIDEFDAFSLDELQLLEVILSQCKDFYICLNTDNILDSKSSVFKPVNDTFLELKKYAENHSQEYKTILCDTVYRYTSNSLKHLNSNIFSNAKASKIEDSSNISITECLDYYQECDYVCSQIRDLVVNGYSYNDIFITARHPEHYTGVIETAFEKYQIPYFVSVDKSSIYTSVMIYIINLLNIVSKRVFNTDDILRYAKNPLSNISFEQSSDLENYCYKWNIKGNLWNEPFIQKGDELSEQARQSILIPIIELKKNIQNKTCNEVCIAIYKFMNDTGVISTLDKTIDFYKDTNQTEYASELSTVWEMLMNILDTICDFMGDSIVSIKEFKDIVCAMISKSNYKLAPQKLDTVTFSSANNSRFNSPKILFVLGVNDGVFPSLVATHGIFTNSDMELLSKKADLTFAKTISDKNADEKFIAYKTLTAPAERLYLTYPLKNTMGDILYPSYILDSIKSLFTDLQVQKASETPLEVTCSTFKSCYDYYVKNFWNNSVNKSTVEEVLHKDAIYSSKVEYLKKISTNTDLKIQDKNIAIRLFKNRLKVYATSFEDFNTCHFKYFCKEGLRLKKPLKMDITTLEIGNIIHYCLENIIKNNGKDGLVSLTEVQIAEQIESLANNYKLEKLSGDYAKSQRFEGNFKRIKKSIIDTVKHIQKEFSQLEFVPKDFELMIDEHAECEPLKISTPDGMQILLCGKIDRVDIFDNPHDGKSYIRVIDYKSGKKDFDTTRIPYGMDMQMFLYLFAVTNKDGKYNGYKPAGVLYMPVSEIKISNKRTNGDSTSTQENSHFKMKGVILNDEVIAKAMEKDIQGVYIPFKIKKKDNTNYNLTLTEQQFNQLEDYCISLLQNMANCLYNGDISAKATIFENDRSNKSDACSYCDYWSICNSYPRKNCNLVTKDIAKEQFNSIIDTTSKNNDKENSNND